MNGRKRLLALLVLSTGIMLVAFQQKAIKVPRTADYGPTMMEYYYSPQKLQYIRPGLNLVIEDISIPEDRRPEITVRYFDDREQPLDRAGRITPGPISMTFILAWYDPVARRYFNYNTRTATSTINGESAQQADRDRGGSFDDLELGRSVYKFASTLPADFDGSRTHTLAIYANRDTRDINEKRYIANVTQDFRPDGDALVHVWEATTNETCNTCHDPLSIHGDQRRDVKLCVTCHNTQSTDPDTGNSVDMAEMIHKIHMGKDLPSVQAGIPYQIIGFRNSLHDYSNVVYPQDIRNCESCHTPNALQGDIWLTSPTIAGCGSCHDNVNFVTGEGHVAGPAADGTCATCHVPQGEHEFDASIVGAHTIPSESTQLAGINLEILAVSGAGPGQSPTVEYRLTNNAGENIAPESLPFLNILLAGPTTDYTFLLSERAVNTSVETENGFAYTFQGSLPDAATGTFVAGMEAFRNVTLNPGSNDEFSHRETAENPVYYFSVDDSPLMARRQIVTDEKCETCHYDLKLHGNIRHEPEYCVMCHSPVADDSPFRPVDQLPARTIDFKHMIHRIHMGEDLTRDYTLIGFMGSVHNYNEALYPGDLRNCESCHLPGTYNVPAPATVATIDPNEFFSPIPPNSSACIGCHDSVDASAHAFVNIAPFGESCGACHGEGREFSVARSHAR